MSVPRSHSFHVSNVDATSDEDGLSVRHKPTVGEVAHQNGYWQFSSPEDEHRSKRYGLLRAEHLMIQESLEQQSPPDVTLRWVPGLLDTFQIPREQTAGQHMRDIYEERRLLHVAYDASMVPVYPVDPTGILLQHRQEKHLRIMDASPAAEQLGIANALPLTSKSFGTSGANTESLTFPDGGPVGANAFSDSEAENPYPRSTRHNCSPISDPDQSSPVLILSKTSASSLPTKAQTTEAIEPSSSTTTIPQLELPNNPDAPQNHVNDYGISVEPRGHTLAPEPVPASQRPYATLTGLGASSQLHAQSDQLPSHTFQYTNIQTPTPRVLRQPAAMRTTGTHEPLSDRRRVRVPQPDSEETSIADERSYQYSATRPNVGSSYGYGQAVERTSEVGGAIAHDGPFTGHIPGPDLVDLFTASADMTVDTISSFATAQFPCIDCGESEHTAACQIATLTSVPAHAIDLRQIADTVEARDPEQWREHAGPSDPLDLDGYGLSLAELSSIIRNEDSYKRDKGLHEVPEAVLPVMWALRTSKDIETTIWFRDEKGIYRLESSSDEESDGEHKTGTDGACDAHGTLGEVSSSDSDSWSSSSWADSIGNDTDEEWEEYDEYDFDYLTNERWRLFID
ncbi:hypothetical protein M011DRAFT_524125 [Sporormia fimetaria CBS 119925]|uniref:Uncharacterized protein n=1 Tax=Sporormia fimetaria CBS 119925 TaxID=1340428 RepID=A0A6A6VKP0_9PLEO|nr:hypothetical protein M011DRAFT_524125 [Sporormia fimetaria CBS 119925]